MESKGKVNAYLCAKCGRIIATINLHTGTTPFIIKCSECGGMAQSSFYRVRCSGSLEIHQCFYRPTRLDFDRLSEESKQFVADGCLLHAPLGTVVVMPDEVQEGWKYPEWARWAMKTYGRGPGRKAK